MQIHLDFNPVELDLIKDSLKQYKENFSGNNIFVNGLIDYIEDKIKERQESIEDLQIYLVKHEERNDIYYCGLNSEDAYKKLENPYLSEDEARKYYMSIYNAEGRMLCTGINKKLK